MSNSKLSRRDFFRTGAIGSSALMIGPGFTTKNESDADYSQVRLADTNPQLPSRYALDLTPAKWIWYPSQRTLANSFILFRRSVKLTSDVKSATGWIVGDSRYQLEVNGKRVQWGPPPADPRFTEADPIDLKEFLKKGENVIGCTVMYYGYGDGTWPAGKPGFILYLKIEDETGVETTILSDGSWQCHLARSWKPGQYKRWYLRALQEEFDARLYPQGWSSPGFELNNTWMKAMPLRGAASKTALSTNSSDYMYNSSSGATVTELRKRAIPLIKEIDIQEIEFHEAYWLHWKIDPQTYFEMIVPDVFDVGEEVAIEQRGDSLEIPLKEDQAIILTFSIEEQVVGWPYFTIDASEGTIIELMVQEGHRLYKDGGPAMMNNHFHSWTRFICRNGENYFSTFDFESVKWIQLHIRGGKGKARLKNLGIKRRMYPWPHAPKIKTSDKTLQKLVDASINTIYNNSLDTIVDGMGRERQQYSGDIGHVLHALYRVFGEERLPARFLNTFSQGITKDGFFLDCWPAYDRLNRLTQRQLDLTQWGPLLDHGVGFNFDCYHHYLYTGKLEDLKEVWPRLVRFFYYLQSILDENGLLPVENLGIPAVWIDHDAYEQQRHKQCAFNLYAIAMMKCAFSTLAKAFGKNDLAAEALNVAEGLQKQVNGLFWDTSKRLFVCNLPWLADEVEERMCDRSLSTAILFDLCPQNQTTEAVNVLVKKPSNLGLSYPPNTNWYLWALGKAGKSEAIFQDFEQRWIKLNSIHQNNTMQEAWNSAPDSGSQWSHASIAPLLSVYMDIAGIKPAEPGYKRFIVEPRPASAEELVLSNHTPFGPIVFSLESQGKTKVLQLEIPKQISGELILDSREKIDLVEVKKKVTKTHYALPGGKKVTLNLAHLE